MDINQSALSGYQSNNKTRRTGIESRAVNETSRSNDTSAKSSSQTAKQLDLKEGQLVKGQIIDIRYNEVKVQLQPGSQVITARLSGDVTLSIGQEAQFQVTEEASDQLVLKYLPNETATPNDATILKALSASGLPMTERNRTLVSELLNQSMPIDKQTLQMMVKLSVMNREASPLTLVLMYKNKIPMSPENIKQFEAYQNGTHQLLNDIKTVSKQIQEMIRPEATTNNNALQSQNISLYTDNSVHNAIQMNGKLLDILYHSSDSTINNTNSNISSSLNSSLNSNISSNLNSTNMNNVPLNNILNQEELARLSNAVEQKIADSKSLPTGIPSDITKQISSGTLTLEETMKLISKLYTGQESVPGQLNSQLINGIMKQSDTPTLLQSSTDNITNKLLDSYLQSQDNTPRLSEIMEETERTSLLKNLATLPEAQGMKEKITQGTASLKETLIFIRESLTRLDKNTTGNLLQSPEYAKLLESAFIDKWTLTPENAAQKSLVSEHYSQLKEDLEKLSTLIRPEKDNAETFRLQEPVKNMQHNLQFMKDLNEVFTYLQLPIKFKDQETHTDLYVMTRKKTMGEARDNLSVLLHLTMTNLGAINVHIKMKPGNQIEADFYTEDYEAGRIIKGNLSSLNTSLEKKGYYVTANVKDTYTKPNFSRDFIEHSSQDNDIRRYTFDIRT